MRAFASVVRGPFVGGAGDHGHGPGDRVHGPGVHVHGPVTGALTVPVVLLGYDASAASATAATPRTTAMSLQSPHDRAGR